MPTHNLQIIQRSLSLNTCCKMASISLPANNHSTASNKRQNSLLSLPQFPDMNLFYDHSDSTPLTYKNGPGTEKLAISDSLMSLMAAFADLRQNLHLILT